MDFTEKLEKINKRQTTCLSFHLVVNMADLEFQSLSELQENINYSCCSFDLFPTAIDSGQH